MSKQGGDKPDDNEAGAFTETVVLQDVDAEAADGPSAETSAPAGEGETAPAEPDDVSDLASTVAVDTATRSSAPAGASEPPPFPSTPPPLPDPTPTPPSQPAPTPTSSAPPPSPAPAPTSPPSSSPPRKVAANAPAATVGPATTKVSPGPAPRPAAPKATRGATTPAAPPAKGALPGWLLPVIGLTAAAALVGYFVARQPRQVAPQPTAQATAKRAPGTRAATTGAPAPPAPSRVHPTPTATARASAAATATASSPAPLRSSSAPAATPAADRAEAADPVACMSAVLPVGSAEADDLAFVCNEAGAREATRSMTTLIARRDAPGDSRRRWAGLGWYRMALVQVMRSRCCGDTEPLAGPASMASCGLDEALAAIDRAAVGGSGLEAAGKRYFTAADCLFKNMAAQAFGLHSPVDGSQLASMLELAGGE